MRVRQDNRKADTPRVLVLLWVGRAVPARRSARVVKEVVAKSHFILRRAGTARPTFTVPKRKPDLAVVRKSARSGSGEQGHNSVCPPLQPRSACRRGSRPAAGQNLFCRSS